MFFFASSWVMANPYLPGYETRPLSGDLDIKTERLLRKTQREIVRVLVFPHLGRYPIPQKRESVVDEVTLSSSGRCKTRIRGGAWIESPSQILFHASSLRVPVRVSCDRAVTVQRESGLKSYAYHGKFEVRALRSESGRDIVQVINELPYEEYLRGVIAAEMLYSWPMEALKVQAIAARTYGLYEVYLARQEAPHQGYDVDDTVFFQAYLGASGITARTDEALRLTRGEVMTQEGRIIKAYFSADSGGYTEAAANVWGKELSYCSSKPEVFDPSLVKSEWTARSSHADVRDRLVKNGMISQGLDVIGLAISDEDRSESGRPLRVWVFFSDGSYLSLGGEQFRYLMNFRSALYHFRADGEGNLDFAGRGFGHGVGMSQEGSRALVNSLQWDAHSILKFYYSGIQIENFLDDSPLVVSSNK